jgi:hypothetical protein
MSATRQVFNISSQDSVGNSVTLFFVIFIDFTTSRVFIVLRVNCFYSKSQNEIYFLQLNLEKKTFSLRSLLIISVLDQIQAKLGMGSTLCE